jgi:hypothetical protein
MVVAVQLCAAQGGAVPAQACVAAVGQPLTHTLSWQPLWQAVLLRRVLSLHSVVLDSTIHTPHNIFIYALRW